MASPRDDDRADNGHGHSDRNGPLPKRHRPSPPISSAEIAEEFSHHDSSVARLNNGSFGCCPASVLAAQSRLQLQFLAQPDDFYINRLQQGLLRSRAALCDLIGAGDVTEVALVDNATTAAAIVFQQVAWSFSEGAFSKGDAVLILHYAYGAVKKSIHAYVARAGAHVIEVPLPFPVSSDDDIIREFRKALALGKSGGRKVRLAVIDHITSMPSVVIPVKELTRICREEGVDQVFIDAAHAIGNVEVDVNDIGADFYTSNLYKWFFCPPAVAFLHTRKGAASSNLHHPVVSHEYGNGLPVESGWIGTRDYTPQLVVPDVVEFVNRFEGGLEGIRKRNHDEIVRMGNMLAEAWGTCLGSPPEMCGSLIMVGLPGCLGISSSKVAMRLRTYLREEFKVEVPIYYNPIKDDETVVEDRNNYSVTGYVRISHQVYNVEDEYYKLRDVINKLVHDGFSCTKLLSN